MNIQECAFRWLFAAAAVLIAGTVNADIYPTQTVKFVVPFPAGGTNTIAMAATAPEIVKRMDDLAVDLVAGSREELARFQRAEIER